MTATAPGRSVVGSGRERLDRGWQAAATTPGAIDDPAAIDALAWLPARVPGTAAGARRDAGLPFGDPTTARTGGIASPSTLRPATRGGRPPVRRPRDDRGRLAERRARPREPLDVRGAHRRRRSVAARAERAGRPFRGDHAAPRDAAEAARSVADAARGGQQPSAGSGRRSSGASRGSRRGRPQSVRGGRSRAGAEAGLVVDESRSDACRGRRRRARGPAAAAPDGRRRCRTRSP